MKIKSNVKAGIDTVPLPECPVPDYWRSAATSLPRPGSNDPRAIGTWPTPE